MQGRIVAPYSRDGIIAQQDEDTLVVNQQLSEWEDYVHSFYIICSSSLVSVRVRYVSYMYNVAYNIIQTLIIYRYSQVRKTQKQTL
jgi:hypothetical protein